MKTKKNVIDYLDHTATLYPDKAAVVEQEKQITFSELHKASHLIANALGRTGLTKSPIAVFIPKGCQMVEAFAGISRSGNFYVPLDTKSPEQRTQQIIDVLEARCVITNLKHYDKLASFYGGTIFKVEELLKTETTIENAREETDTQIDTDPVYSIFTSGSTGTPKGVIVSHRGVIDYIDWAVDTFGFNETTVIGNQAPFYFDNSTLDIYLMYATGATLDIIPDSYFAFPAKLVDYLNEHKISFVFWVPFVLANVANMDIFSTKLPKYLKDVFFAGEVMPTKHLNYWRRLLPECRYANLYGPTEITVDCTYYLVDREFSDNEPLPIGKPCRNTDVLILVDRKRLATPGEQGELCVRGSSLALGYYNNPEKTKDAFIQNPLNHHYPELIYCTGDMVYTNEYGEIMYVGRIDSQIKHNGYRIELGEIENAILGTGLVKNCCVTYDFVNKKIVAFYQADEELNMAEFRKATMNKIPKYMMPTACNRVAAMKTNANGKIDRLHYKKLVNG